MNAGCVTWDDPAGWRSAEAVRAAGEAGLPASGRVAWDAWPGPGRDPVTTSASAVARLVSRCLPDVAAAHEVLTDAAGLAARARQSAAG
jgi:hypothetical protein